MMDMEQIGDGEYGANEPYPRDGDAPVKTPRIASSQAFLSPLGHFSSPFSSTSGKSPGSPAKSVRPVLITLAEMKWRTSQGPYVPTAFAPTRRRLPDTARINTGSHPSLLQLLLLVVVVSSGRRRRGRGGGQDRGCKAQGTYLCPGNDGISDMSSQSLTARARRNGLDLD